MKCEHGKERSRCKDCFYAGTGGGSFCEHERLRSDCAICSPEASFRDCARKAKERSLPFALSLSEFQAITSQDCFYCSQQPSGGVDRINNFYGYTPGNSRPCCGICNRIKGTLSHEFLYQHLEKMCRQMQKHKEKTAQLKAAVSPQIAA